MVPDACTSVMHLLGPLAHGQAYMGTEEATVAWAHLHAIALSMQSRSRFQHAHV